ncbi:MAG: sugar phosphate nucleotidyltransferase [Candidatus Parvarchaeota archaeon]|nr:sugar phosphate nucleotidyltransferase [Candidatus Parvarchaeum tengchongense]MCW1299242.1 sugar phosphate nucleotidyltransferase [Candidatus Parvarchaeum tengchongense]MCW1312624.1 sugar phosphate nucleotidyltransferase [Candidatus Parvarchaeum tengchongense]
MKKRITITINEKTLEKIDKTIDGINIPNRSIAIERLIKEHFEPNKNKIALILAGGSGTRLRPLTYEIPKPMMPVNGRPILEHIMEQLKKAEFIDIIISIGYLGSKIKEYFGDGSKFGVRIRYSEETTPMGTGGAIKKNQNIFHDDFIVLNGDNLFDFDLNKIYEFHKKEKAMATIALVPQDDVSQFGVVEMEGNKIVKFIEKPKTEQVSHLVNAGIYVINPAFLSFIPQGESNISKIFEQVAEKKIIDGFIYAGKWLPCDSMDLYDKAIKNWP